MKPRHTRIGGFLLLLAALLSCAGTHRAYFDLSAKTPATMGVPIRTKGFFLGERLVGVSDMPAGERGIINAVVFALTQPGGIAKQYMRR